ncbi:hypothetical protein HY637_03860 [Candidatus Woesearchaeota archaeon]|nr:hypothetical protein [Candidatus Woesearchaeota archaeon]
MAELSFYKNWMELFLLIDMIIGLVLALLIPSAFLGYVLIFLSGIFAGRVVYERKSKIVFPYIVIIATFLIGYLIGMRYGDYRVVIILFLIGAIVSYKLFDRGVLRDFRF